MKILILHYIESQIINYNQIFTSNSTLFKGRLIALKLSIVTGGTLVINTVKKVKGYFINNRKTYKKSCLKKQKKV